MPESRDKRRFRFSLRTLLIAMFVLGPAIGLGVLHVTKLIRKLTETNVRQKPNEDHTESGGTLGPYCFEIPGDGVTGDETVTIIDSWQTLPESVKADILAMVKAG